MVKICENLALRCNLWLKIFTIFLDSIGKYKILWVIIYNSTLLGLIVLKAKSLELLDPLEMLDNITKKIN